VLPGGTGPFYGAYPNSLSVRIATTYAPRLGIAWKQPAALSSKTVVRLGYGINYNLAQYGNHCADFAFIRRLRKTATNSSIAPGDLTLASGFPAINPGIVTNNYAGTPTTRLGLSASLER